MLNALSIQHSERGFPMPQEFLRDVLRTGDAAGRRHRHWSLLPLSIAGHAAIVLALLLSPLVSGVELPAIASPLADFIPVVAPTPPPPPSPPTHLPRRNIDVPTEAPATIAPEAEAPTREPVPGGIPDGPGVGPSQPLLTDLGTTGPATVAPPPPPVPVPKMVRVGGVIREPRKLVHVAPVYPEIARLSRVQGIVTMEAVLDATGKVESVRVLSSQPLLEEAAVRAVRQWRYTPTELNGVPVPVLMTITIRFSLDR
jgi:protein TonB